MFLQNTAGTPFRGSRFLFSWPLEGVQQRKPAYKYPTSRCVWVTCWFRRSRFRVVADEGDNFESRFRANRIAIVLPSLHSLICYTKHLSHLDVGQIPVNSCLPEVFAKRLRMRWNRFLNPPINRNHWKTCDNRPATNIQQGARHLLPPSLSLGSLGVPRATRERSLT